MKLPARVAQEVLRALVALGKWSESLLSRAGWATGASGKVARSNAAGGGGPPGPIAGTRPAPAPPLVEAGGVPATIEGVAEPAAEGTYLLIPFEVAPGVSRIDVDYEYHSRPPAPADDPLLRSAVDLGLWDEGGYRSPTAFRGWSGDRHAKVFVQSDLAERGYRPAPVHPGRWHVELGMGAVGPAGTAWRVTVRGSAPRVGPPPGVDRVDAAHVADPAPGWYHGDLHVHGWHSHPGGPGPADLVRHARDADLDFLPVTEYVVGHHWGEYGEVQRANPDMVIWPGREIVTYQGHVHCLGETPGFIEYRHGFEDVTIGDIQRAVRDAGALFGVNHPTTFPGLLFRRYCRGCAFDLGGEIDWNAVDTIEVLTGPPVVDAGDGRMGRELAAAGVAVENPFTSSAVALWESLLNRGHRICAVGGSDDKTGGGVGTPATALWASELSRAGLVEAIRSGRAYVRTRGVRRSPALEMVVEGPDGGTGGFGSEVRLDGDRARVRVRVTVTGGAGQCLRIVRNGRPVSMVAVDADPFEHEFLAMRVRDEGPLGTWYRVETLDAVSRTTIGNPVFLTGDREPEAGPTN